MCNYTHMSIVRTNKALSLSSAEKNWGQAVELSYFRLAVALSHDV